MGAIGQERRLHVTNININDGTIAVIHSNRNRSVVANDAAQSRHVDLPPIGAFRCDDDDDNMVVGSILLSRCFGCSVVHTLWNVGWYNPEESGRV
jgi:hypothetical protein